MKKHLACLLALGVVGCAFAVDAAAGTPQAHLKQYLQLKYSGSDIPEWLQSEINPISQTPSRVGGDTAAEAVVIDSLPYADNGTTAGKANDIGPYNRDNILCTWSGYYGSSYTGSSSDVFYSLHLDEATVLDVSLCDSDYDTSLGLFEKVAGAPGNMLAGNDDFCDSQSRFICEIPAGDYFIVVDGYDDEEGDYSLSVESSVIVDPCTDVPEIALGDVIEADAPTVNNFSGSGCGVHNGYDDVYQLTLTEDTALTVNMATTSDMALVILTDCDDVTSCVAYSDPNTLSTVLQAGTYFVVADFYGANVGAAYTLTVTGVTVGDPCLDVPEIAIGDVIEADAPTVNYFSNSGCGNHNGFDDIYQLTLTEDTPLSITMDTPGDEAIVILTDCEDVTSCVAYSDPSVLETFLLAGTYYVVADFFSSGAGSAYTLTVGTYTDVCDTPTEIAVGDVIEADAPTENHFSGASCGTHNGYDDLYTFTLTEETELEIEMEASSDGAMLILTDCHDLASCVDYSDPAVMVTTLPAGTYYLVADFYYSSAGSSYTLSMIEYVAPCDVFTEGVLTLESPVSGTTVGAPNVYSGNYGDAGYTFEVTVAGSYTFSTCSANTSYGTYLYLLDASPCDEAVTQITYGYSDACSDAGHTVGIIEEEWLEIGTYHLLVGGYAEGTFELSAMYHEPCVDYDCTGLTQEGEGYYPGQDPPVYVDTFNGGCDTDSTQYTLVFPGDEWCGTFFTYVNDASANKRDSDWYEFTLTEPSDVTLSAYSCGDFYLKVLNECTSLISVTGDETQTLSGWLNAGTYQIAIYPSLTTGMPDETSYHMELSATPNDPCESVMAIECGETLSREEPVGNYFYGANLNDGCAAYAHNGPDETFAFTLDQTTTVSIVMTPVSGDASLFLISECGNPASCIENSDSGTSNPETIETELEAGTYYIVADYYTLNPSNGNYTLSLSCTTDPNPPVVVHEPIEGALDAQGPYTITATVTDAESGVSSVSMYYRTEIGDFNEVAMTADGDVFTASIAALEFGCAAEYYIVAVDGMDNVTQTDNYFFWPIDWSLAPRELAASDGELGATTIEWIAPEYAQGQLQQPAGMFIESFENGIPSTWTVIDVDGGDDWVAYSSDSYDGDACVSVWYDTPNDDYLITPALTPTGTTSLTFYAKADDSDYDETLEFMVSTTDTDPASFTLIDTQVLENVNGWTELSYDLGGYAGQQIYVAFHCISDDMYRLLLDYTVFTNLAETVQMASSWVGEPVQTVEEIFTRKGNTLSKEEIASMLQQQSASERSFVGYNVYRDGQLLSSVTELEYVDGLSTGAVQDQVYTYYVTAVYDAGESAASDSDTGYFAGRPTAGGPDTFGYTWESSLNGGDVSYGWIEHTASAVELSLDDSQNSGELTMGMDFPFYGESQSTIFVNSNGHLTFDAGFNYTGAQAYPNSSTPNNIIALWADDLDPIVETPIDPATQILYELIDGAFVVSYINVPQWISGTETIDDCISAQAVLYADGDIQYNYRSFGSSLNTTSSCAIGIENATGVDGLSVRYQNDGCDLVDEMSIRITSPTQGGNCEEAPVTAIVTNGANIELSWTEVSGATSYRVLASGTGFANFSELAVVNELSYTVTNALAEGKQFFKVVAVCE